jgi:hypothetical protein
MNPASSGDLLVKSLYIMIISPETQSFFRPVQSVFRSILWEATCAFFRALKNRPDRAEEVEE